MSLNGRPPLFKRKFLILPKFQKDLLLQMSLILIAYYIGDFLINHFLLDQLLSIPGGSEKVLDEGAITEFKSKFIIASTLKFFFILILFAIWGLLITHKIAGPIFRMTQIIQSAKRGESPDTFEIRSGDYFHGLATEIKEYVLQTLPDKMSEKFSKKS